MIYNVSNNTMIYVTIICPGMPRKESIKNTCIIFNVVLGQVMFLTDQTVGVWPNGFRTPNRRNCFTALRTKQRIYSSALYLAIFTSFLKASIHTKTSIWQTINFLLYIRIERYKLQVFFNNRALMLHRNHDLNYTPVIVGRSFMSLLYHMLCSNKIYIIWI